MATTSKPSTKSAASRGAAPAAAARVPATARSGTTASTISAGAGGGGASSSSSASAARRATASYREILVARSDGVRYTVQQINDATSGSGAAPVGEALRDEDLPRHDVLRAWCVRLGRAVHYNLGRETAAASSSSSGNYLVRLPRGYAMHVRSTTTARGSGNSSSSSSSSSREVAVYGHPLGAAAAYRTPAELALHVLWLLSASTARADCSCRLCVRMVAEADEGAGAAAAAPATMPLPPSLTPVLPAPSRPHSTTTTTTTSTPPTAAAAATAAANTTTIPAARLPAGGSADLFRPWELVWYQHVTTPSKGAWRLGIVLGAEATAAPAASTTTTTFPIAPLGIAGTHPPALAVAAADLRPFLSFSVPAMRAGFQNALYDQLNWRAILDTAVRAQAAAPPPAGLPPAYDPPTVALEASKAAANQINACFSLVNRQPAPPGTAAAAAADGGPSHLLYQGVFLGAELILVGDAVRVDPAPSPSPSPGVPGGGGGGAAAAAAAGAGGMAVLQVAQIVVERASQLLWLVGDVYCLASWTPPPQQQQQGGSGGNHPPVAAPAAPAHALPQPAGQVFGEEVADRNARWQTPAAAAAPPVQWYWHCLERRASRAEAAVHGRFYASARLAANLQNPGALAPLTAALPPTASAVVGAPFVASALNRRHKVDGFVYRGWRAGRAATVGSAVSVPLNELAGAAEDTALVPR